MQNQKSCTFRFFKVANLCLDSFTHSWHSLNQLHLECFSNGLEGVPTHPCWLHFVHSVVQLFLRISIGLRLGDWGGQVI